MKVAVCLILFNWVAFSYRHIHQQLQISGPFFDPHFTYIAAGSYCMTDWPKYTKWYIWGSCHSEKKRSETRKNYQTTRKWENKEREKMHSGLRKNTPSACKHLNSRYLWHIWFWNNEVLEQERIPDFENRKQRIDNDSREIQAQTYTNTYHACIKFIYLCLVWFWNKNLARKNTSLWKHKSKR